MYRSQERLVLVTCYFAPNDSFRDSTPTWTTWAQRMSLLGVHGSAPMRLGVARLVAAPLPSRVIVEWARYWPAGYGAPLLITVLIGMAHRTPPRAAELRSGNAGRVRPALGSAIGGSRDDSGADGRSLRLPLSLIVVFVRHEAAPRPRGAPMTVWSPGPVVRRRGGVRPALGSARGRQPRWMGAACRCAPRWWGAGAAAVGGHRLSRRRGSPCLAHWRCCGGECGRRKACERAGAPGRWGAR